MAEVNPASSTSSAQTVTLTSVFSLKTLGDGKFELTEIPSDEFTPPDFHSGNRKSFDVPLPIPGGKVSLWPASRTQSKRC